MDNKVIIEKLRKDKIDETVEVLIKAFKDEAFTKVWLDLSCERIQSAYSTASKLKFLLSLEAGHPIFVAVEKDKVIGFIVLKASGLKIRTMKAIRLIIRNLPVLITLLPSFIRVMRLGSSAMKPPQSLPDSYYSLEAIAVDPQYQGKKVGRILLEYAHSLCLADKASTGIYLFTGDEKNKNIYERFGYELIETRNTNGFISYHMFLANS